MHAVEPTAAPPATRGEQNTSQNRRQTTCVCKGEKALYAIDFGKLATGGFETHCAPSLFVRCPFRNLWWLKTCCARLKVLAWHPLNQNQSVCREQPAHCKPAHMHDAHHVIFIYGVEKLWNREPAHMYTAPTVFFRKTCIGTICKRHAKVYVLSCIFHDCMKIFSLYPCMELGHREPAHMHSAPMHF